MLLQAFEWQFWGVLLFVPSLPQQAQFGDSVLPLRIRPIVSTSGLIFAYFVGIWTVVQDFGGERFLNDKYFNLFQIVYQNNFITLKPIILTYIFTFFAFLFKLSFNLISFIFGLSFKFNFKFSTPFLNQTCSASSRAWRLKPFSSLFCPIIYKAGCFS